VQIKKNQPRLGDKISKQPNEILPIVSKLAIRAGVLRIRGKRSNPSQETLYGVSKSALREGVVRIRGKRSNPSQEALYDKSNFPLAGASALCGGVPRFLFEPFPVRSSGYSSQTNDTPLGMERSKTNKMLCPSLGLIYFLKKKNQLKFLKINDLI